MFLRKGSRKSIYLYGLAFLFIFINQRPYALFLQDQYTQWSIPQTIPLYHWDSNPPILIADQNRTVHALSSQWKTQENGERLLVIVYSRWTLEQRWTRPIDIIISPIKEARLTDAYLDNDGIMHVVFWGGDNTNADIYYSKAPAAMADDANAWSPPMIIGYNAGDPEGGVLVEDDQGMFYILFNGREFGNGLYLVSSSDRGENWSDSAPIFFNQSDKPNLAQLQAISGKSGALHAVWGVYDTHGQGRGVFYSRSEDGTEWSEPILLADAQEGLGTQKPIILEYKDRLIALFNLSLKIMMMQSRDDGNTWEDPAVIFLRHIGVNGDMSLLVDGNDDLHLFFGQRIPGPPDIHGMWHSMFADNRWTEPEAIIKGPLIVDQVGDKGFDPFFARAVVSQGNVILATWRTDPRSKGNGVWYSYQKIDAPELPVVELPSSVDSNNPGAISDTPVGNTPIATTSSISTSENDSAIQVPTNKPRYQYNPSLPIIIGSLLALMLIFAVSIAYGVNRGK